MGGPFPSQSVDDRRFLGEVLSKAPWLNWIEQPPPKGQVAGSNPAGVAIVMVLNCRAI